MAEGADDQSAGAGGGAGAAGKGLWVLGSGAEAGEDKGAARGEEEGGGAGKPEKVGAELSPNNSSGSSSGKFSDRFTAAGAATDVGEIIKSP